MKKSTINEAAGGFEAAFRFVFNHLFLEHIGHHDGQPLPPHRERLVRERREGKIIPLSQLKRAAS